jgi:SAM-dependent methyltransferase
MVDREAVRSNAKYLRSVRPIDPEEIFEYVEGRPHPAAVRTVLREEALDLEVVERADGTFVPAPTGPLDPRGWGPSALPAVYARALEDALVERYGANWHRGASGDRLRETIRTLKADYFRDQGRDVEYDAEVALAYAVYHLPDYYATIGYVLEVVARAGLLPRRLRVLDVGAGVGGPALGLHDYVFEPPAAPAEVGRVVDEAGADGSEASEGAGTSAGEESDPDPGRDQDPDPDPDPTATPATRALVDYHAVEPSAAADLLERFLGETGRNFHATVHRTTAEAFTLPGDGSEGPEDGDADGHEHGRDGGTDDPYDLIVFSNVLSELSDPEAVASRYLDALAEDGTLALVAPADLETATTLRAVERALADRPDVTVFAPTLRLWPDAAPSDRGWSFDRGTDLDPPPAQRRLDEAGDDPGTYTNETVKFAYALLRTDGRRRTPVVASADRHARLGALDRHVTNRVNLLAVKLSHDLTAQDGDDGAGREGGNPLFKIGDGSESVEVYAVVPDVSALNRTLLDAPYGAVLSVEGGLVLWNEDEGAYNVVIDGESVVDRVA